MKNAIKILGIFFFLNIIMSCANNGNDKNTETDYDLLDSDVHVMVQQEHFDFEGSDCKFECHDYKSKFDGSDITLFIHTLAIKSKELGGILATENYLNSNNNPDLHFVGKDVQESNIGGFQYIVNGKIKANNLTNIFKNRSIQLVFNFDKPTQKLVGELRFTKPEHFEGIEDPVIGIKLN